VQDLTGKTDQLDGLTRIGIDEISYRKGHRYLTCVVDHDTGRLWQSWSDSTPTRQSFQLPTVGAAMRFFGNCATQSGLLFKRVSASPWISRWTGF